MLCKCCRTLRNEVQPTTVMKLLWDYGPYIHNNNTYIIYIYDQYRPTYIQRHFQTTTKLNNYLSVTIVKFLLFLNGLSLDIHVL